MDAHSPPRYVKATLLTALAAALLPASRLVLAYLDYTSPQWDPQADSDAVQGFMISALATSLALLHILVAFPVAGRRLHQARHLGPAPFIKLVALWLVALCFVVAGAISLQVGGLSFWLPLALVLFCTAALLTLPFTRLWLWLSL
jgi:hypothetical protein